MKVEINTGDQTVFVSGCKHVYFCCKVGHFNMGVNSNCFEISLKRALKELQCLALPHGLHFTASEVDACYKPAAS